MGFMKQFKQLAFKIYELLWRLIAARRTVILPPPAVSDSISKPIFLIGCPRSGTTLLRVILDSHPNVACPAETFYLLDLEKFWSSDDAAKGLQEMGYDREHVRRKLRDFAGYFLRGYAQSRGKTRVAEKTPHYVACLDFIEEMFGPEAQYVMLYRHPFDMVMSMVNHYTIDWHPVVGQYVAQEPDRYSAYARFWADHVSKMLDFESRHADRCIRVRYEDVVKNTEPTLRRMFDGLNEVWSDEVLTYYNKQHDLGRGDRKALMQKGIKPSVDNWRALDAEVLHRMAAIVRKPASQLGYDDLELPTNGQPRVPAAVSDQSR